MGRLFRAVLLAVLLASTSANAVQRRSEYIAFQASAEFEDGYLQLECLIGTLFGPELRTLIVFRDNRVPSTETRTFVLSTGDVPLSARRISSSPLAFRHTAMSASEIQEVIEFISPLAQFALDRATGKQSQVALRVGGGGPDRQVISSDGLETLVSMCSRAFSSAYRQARSSRDIRALTAVEIERNGACRGGSGDDPNTELACLARNAYGLRLNELGQCYGRTGEAGFQMRWHQCGPNSVRSPYWITR